MGPSIKYLVSSPYGDIPVDVKKWDLPLDGDPLKTTYKTYFQTIKKFLAQNEFKTLIKIIREELGRKIKLKDIKEIVIRCEKHGGFCHPASIDIKFTTFKIKFGINVAVTNTGRRVLKREFSLIKQLHKKNKLIYLPKVYSFGKLNLMSFLLEEWFDGYHEFHLSRDNKGKIRLKLWDFTSGYKYLSHKQAFEIYKQSSKILTLYYSIKDYKEICPWHHAAGDFVAKITDNKTEVRLITARSYKSILDFNKNINPLIALFYFFLNLTIRMRLDKLDGIGEVVWSNDSCVDATIAGFFDALRLKRESKDGYISVEKFIKLLKSFSKDEIKTTFKPLIDIYNGSEDLPVILANLEKHIHKLFISLQTLPS